MGVGCGRSSHPKRPTVRSRPAFQAAQPLKPPPRRRSGSSWGGRGNGALSCNIAVPQLGPGLRRGGGGCGGWRVLPHGHPRRRVPRLGPRLRGDTSGERGRVISLGPPRRRPGSSWAGRCNEAPSCITGVSQLGPGLRRGGGGGGLAGPISRAPPPVFAGVVEGVGCCGIGRNRHGPGVGRAGAPRLAKVPDHVARFRIHHRLGRDR